MRKKIFKTLAFALVMSVIMIGLYETVVATSKTLGVTWTQKSGINYLKGAYTFAAATDTAHVPFSLVPGNSALQSQAAHDTTIAVLVIRTQRAKLTGSAASIAVRWGYSMDGTSFTYNTVGTDSTSWATLSGDSASSQGTRSWSTLAVPLGPTFQPAFWVPYNDVMIVGRAANAANVKVEAYIIPRF